MPAFKFSYFNPNFGYGVFGFRANISFDFQAEHLPDNSNFELVAPALLFEIEAISSDFINIPLPVFYFEAIEAETVVSEVEIVTPLLDLFFEEMEEISAEASVSVKFPPLFIIELDVPALNEAWVRLKLEIDPLFEVMIPIIGEVSIQLSSIRPELVGHEAIAASLSMALRSIQVEMNATLESVNGFLVQIESPVFDFYVFTEETELEFNVVLPLLTYRSMLISIGEPQEGDIIKFNYEEWIFDSLKAIMPDYDDEEIIAYIHKITQEET